MEVIGQYVATPLFIEPLQIEHTSMKPLYPIIELIEFCLELALEIQLRFGDSLRFGASLRRFISLLRFISLRSFTSEIRLCAQVEEDPNDVMYILIDLTLPGVDVKRPRIRMINGESLTQSLTRAGLLAA